MYELVTYPEVRVQVAALPWEAKEAYLRVLVEHLQHEPWAGDPQHEDNPGGAVRRWGFGPDGAGMVVYLILDGPQHPQPTVHIAQVTWFG